MRIASRRRAIFLTTITAVGVVTAVSASSPAAGGAHVTAALHQSVAQPAVAALPAATCTLAGNTRTCRLWAREGQLILPSGSSPASVPVWGFSRSATGTVTTPGPVIVAMVGETLDVVLHNTLTLDLSLAFPGRAGVPDTVGVPFGASKTYHVALDRPGTFLYEAGLTANGPRQVAMGLHGALIVRPATPARAYGPGTEFDDEVVEVISAVDPALTAAPFRYDLGMVVPRFWLLNGHAFPDTGALETAAGHRVLIRYVNAGLTPASMGALGTYQTKIAQDSRPFAYQHDVVAETIPPGATLDTIIDIPAGATDGTQYALFEQSGRLDNGGKRTGPIVDFGGALTFVTVSPIAAVRR